MTISLRWMGLLLAATMLGGAVRANEEPVYAPPPAWVENSDKALPAGKPARGKLLLLNEVEARIDAGRLEIFSDTAYHVASAEMLGQLGTLNLQWQPDRQDLVIHRLQIVRDGTPIDLLAGGKRLTILRREQALEQNAIDGMLTATLPVEGLRVGDIVRFATSHIQTNPTLPMHGEIEQYLPVAEQQIAPTSYRIIWPEALPVRWRARGEKVEVREANANGLREVRVTVPVAKQPETPGDAPARFNMAPLVQFSSIAAWSDLSRLHAPAYSTDGAIALGSPLAAERDRIARASNDPQVRMVAALQLVQREVRYLYNGLGTGNYDPQAPADTWQLRSGDCKAKTKLLLALLRDLGISADAVLVHSALGDALPERLPALGVFDHVIVRARIGDSDYWLDGTTAGANAANISDVPPFRMGLPLLADGSDLVALPERAPSVGDFAVELTYDQSHGIVYPPLVDARVTFRGGPAVLLKTLQEQASEEQLDELVQGLVAPMSGGGRVIRYTLDTSGPDGSAVVSAHMLGNMFWNRSEGAPAFSPAGPLAAFSFAPDRSRTAWKDIPVRRDAMRNLLVRHYKLPGGGKSFDIEGGQTFNIDVAGTRLERTATRAGGIISIRESQSAAAGEIGPQAWPAARAAAAQANERPLRFKAKPGYASRWQEIQATRDSKALAPLLAAYQALIDKDPEDASNYANRAGFYRGIFRDDLALADYDRAIAIEDDAETRGRRAATLLRLNRADDALTDLNAALAQKPGEGDLTTDKAETLRRLGRFDEALALVDEKVGQGGNEHIRWLSLKAEIAGYAGQGDQSLSLADATVALEPDSPDALNIRCWMKGLLDRDHASALADCNRAVALASDPTDILDSRALIHYRAGRIADALADYDAVLLRNPGHPGSLFMRALIYQQQGRRADAQRDLAGARMLDPWLDRDMAAWGLKP